MTVVLLPPSGLAPLHAALAALGPAPRLDALTALAVADRWMTDGARLIAAGEHLVAAHRAAGDDRDPAALRRRVAARLYGIDPQRAHVTAARRALTAWAAHPEHPPLFVDHTLRRGDPDWMYTPAQLAAFDPAPDAPAGALAAHLAPLHARHRAHRAAIHRAAAHDPAAAAAALERADATVDLPRVIGDVLAGCVTDAGHLDAPEHHRRRALVTRWLDHRDPRAEAELRALQATLRRARATFHWQTELSELYPDAWTPTPAGAA